MAFSFSMLIVGVPLFSVIIPLPKEKTILSFFSEAPSKLVSYTDTTTRSYTNTTTTTISQYLTTISY